MSYILFFLSLLGTSASSHDLFVAYHRCVEDQAMSKLATGEDANVVVAMGESRCASHMREIELKVRVEVTTEIQSMEGIGALPRDAVAKLVDGAVLARVNHHRKIVRDAAVRNVGFIRSKLIEDGVDLRTLTTGPASQSISSIKRKQARPRVVQPPASPVKSQILVNASGTCERNFQSGEWLRPPTIVNAIQHSVTIKNGSNIPAVVKLTDAEAGSSSLFYVQRNSSGTVFVSDGRYRIQYALGGRLAADCETVLQPEHASEFQRDIALRTQRDDSGYSTSVIELTLYKVPGGNVTTSKISAKEFNDH